jgi:hypothetical protein
MSSARPFREEKAAHVRVEGERGDRGDDERTGRRGDAKGTHAATPGVISSRTCGVQRRLDMCSYPSVSELLTVFPGGIFPRLRSFQRHVRPLQALDATVVA